MHGRERKTLRFSGVLVPQKRTVLLAVVRLLPAGSGRAVSYSCERGNRLGLSLFGVTERETYSVSTSFGPVVSGLRDGLSRVEATHHAQEYGNNPDRFRQ